VQRPAPGARLARLVEPARLSQRQVAVEVRPGADLGLAGGDAVQARPGQILGRNLARRDGGAGAGGAERREVAFGD